MPSSDWQFVIEEGNRIIEAEQRLQRAYENFVPYRSRRENRPASGTLTLRRTSTTPFAQSSGENASIPNTASELSGVSQSVSGYEPVADYRLSKEALLQIYRNQEESGAFNTDVSDLYENGWNPGQTSATNGRSGWGKVNDNRDNHGPDVCWDVNGDVRPISFEDMSEEEKNVRLNYALVGWTRRLIGV